MMKTNGDISTFLRAATRCETLEQLSSVLAQATMPFGMTGCASGMVTGPRAVSQNPSHFNNWPQGWTELYQSQRFFFRDPVVRWAMLSGAPATWSWPAPVG